ncbi:sodium:proline symporter [Oxalobacteraceae bacterium OM1]|nr:sodium:proline symporter [Oxalobacteraceae bacterium OM1]
MIVSRMPAWCAALLAGWLAGGVATLFEVALWWLAGDAVIATLWRDTRRAAAVLLGPTVLPPPDTIDLHVFAAAALVHLLLSSVYGLLQIVLARLVAPRAMALAGAVFGLAVFVMNMYGFTLLFPWFADDRDGITAAAHVVFGASAAMSFALLRALGRRTH